MKKIIVLLFAALGVGIGLAWASTVSTTDGVNFSVTNDVGKVANYTNDALSQEVGKANATVQSDYDQEAAKERDILRDTEILATWQSVKAMSVNAASARSYANATCTGNTECWSGSCTNSVCE